MRNDKFNAWFQRFMQGRYGADRLGLYLSVGSVAMMVLSFLCGTLTRGRGRLAKLFFYAAMACLVYCSFRLLSRDFSARRRENEAFEELLLKLEDWAGLQRTRFDQRKTYVFLSCPGCRQTMRVPRGKGKIRITCRRCGYTFERKT